MKAIAILLFLVATMAHAQDIPRPEHPRPDFQRTEWLNLNGKWDFAETDDSADLGFLNGKAFPDTITVPFCRESKLSGLGRTGFVTNVWYKRTFNVPANWKSTRVRLNIGACDWRTTVYVNGEEVGEHTGGSVAFGFEITGHLKKGANTVIIHAFDDTRSGLQALGKQCNALDSYGCLYTRTTGIWQTVWLEGLGSSYLSKMRLTPDLKEGKLHFEGEVVGGTEKTVGVEIFDGARRVARASMLASSLHMGIPIPNPHLWSPKDPHLYRVVVSVNDDHKTLDTVESYVGMRSVTIKGRQILINGQPIFQRLVLDQGFYPTGIWSAPSDAELKKDIERSMAVGFNGARLHQKVFEPRFLYHADQMGYLVWGEFPNWGLNYGKDIDTNVLNEWREIVERDYNHPAIIGWCPFNETGQDAVKLQNKVANLTKRIDQTRPLIDTSGYTHGWPQLEVMDAHDYDQDPKSFRARYESLFNGGSLPARYRAAVPVNVPFMVSEYGGIGWDTGAGWGYGTAPKTLTEFYQRLKGLTDALMDNPNMFGFCYTQLTDVEQEHNGMYKYDRTPKFDIARVHAILSRPAAFETTRASGPVRANVAWDVIVGSAVDANHVWSYTTSEPGSGWETGPVTAWKIGNGGFGTKDGAVTGTPWTTSDIWLRRDFDVKSLPKSAQLVIHYDNAAEVYVNGKLVWESARGAWNDRYDGIDISRAFAKAVRSGRNTIAVHCHQDTGGQYIDLAILGRG